MLAFDLLSKELAFVDGDEVAEGVAALAYFCALIKQLYRVVLEEFVELGNQIVDSILTLTAEGRV